MQQHGIDLQCIHDRLSVFAHASTAVYYMSHTCLTMAWISEVISLSDFSGAGCLHMRAHVS